MNEILWLFPILFIFHDMEEIIGYGLWLSKNRAFLDAKYPKISNTYKPYSTEGMAAAVMEELVICLIVCVIARFTGFYGLWFGAFVAYLQQYHFTDFAEKTKVIKNFEHIVWLVVFAMSAVIILKIWYKLCRKFIFEIRDNLKENYFITSLKTISIKYILLVIIAIGIPMLLLTVFWISDFSIYIVSKYIPCDNIFDVSYYLQTIIENENLQNSLTLTGNTYLLKLYSNTFTVLIWLTIIFVIWLFFIIVKIISLYKQPQQS